MGSISGLMEGVVMSLLFVVLLTSVLAHFNTQYGQDHSVGLDTSALDTFNTQLQTAYEQTGGEVTQTTTGLSLSSSWALVKGLFGVTWSFFNGSWIPTIIIGLLKIEGTAGITISSVLRLLFLGTLIWSIVRLFFKVKA